MSGVSFPVTRPIGHALIVGNAACRSEALRVLQPQGYICAEAEDPYAGMIELCRDRLAYQTVILCLGSLYREELYFIATLKRRLPHVEIWLAQSDGRMASLAEGMRLGADGLLAEDGSLHRVAALVPHHPGGATSEPPPYTTSPLAPGERDEIERDEAHEPSPPDAAHDESPTGSGGGTPEAIGEPVLTADELRALLQDQTSMPPAGNVE